MKDEENSGDAVERLRTRTKAYALRAIKLFVSLPKSIEAQILGKQFLRSATSVGAHYREAKRAKSDADFISKIEGGLQEIEEAQYWLELITESRLLPARRVEPLMHESEELIAILVSIAKKAKGL